MRTKSCALAASSLGNNCGDNQGTRTAPHRQHQEQPLQHLKGDHILHRNAEVEVNRVAGQWPPPSQHSPRIQKEAPFSYFWKIHPHSIGHIRRAYGVAIMVIQIHDSWEPWLSLTLLQRLLLIGFLGAWGREGCKLPMGNPWTHSLVVVVVVVVMAAAVIVAGIFCLMP